MFFSCGRLPAERVGVPGAGRRPRSASQREHAWGLPEVVQFTARKAPFITLETCKKIRGRSTRHAPRVMTQQMRR